MKIMERKYKCKNGVIERTRFAVGDNTQIRKRWRKAKSSTDKREENLQRAVRELARILNCNMDSTGYLSTLTFDKQHLQELGAGLDRDQLLDEVTRQAALFARRLRRKCGKDLKIITVPSDQERTEEGELIPARVHIHVVTMGATPEQIRDSWAFGLTDHESLYEHQEDYTPLAVYLLMQVRSRKNKRKYACSRNMEKPVIEDRVVVGDPGAEIRVQPGARVLDRLTYREGSVVQYVRYKNKPRIKRGGRKREAVPDGPVQENSGT